MTQIDGVHVQDSLVSLSAAGVPVVQVRWLEDRGAEEVVNGDGVVVFGPVRSWTLRGNTLTFEYGERSAASLGFPTLHELTLDVPEPEIARARDELLDILSGTCCVIDTPGLRHSE